MNNAYSDLDLLQLSEEQAGALYEQGKEAVIWALLQLSVLARQKHTDAQAVPSTPSSMIPPYHKPSGKKRPKKRGRKAGHPGARRPAPAKIDRREEHTLQRCPDCGGPVSPSRKRRTRVVEDITPTQPETTEHIIHSHYCPQCKKRVEPKLTCVLPHATIGNRALLLSAWLHYGLSQTIAQIVAVFGSLFQLQISAGALTQQWARLGLIFEPWHAQIAEEIRGGGVLQADETGWRVNGQTHWLWCFANSTASYYHIDASRGSQVVNEFLKGEFAGALVSDFFSAYNLVCAREYQKCLAHLLREIKAIDQNNDCVEWLGLRRTLVRLLKDALRLGVRNDREQPDFISKRTRIEERMDSIIHASGEWKDANARRIVKRLSKYRTHLFTFLYNPAVPPDNNHTEREIRPAVITRKNSLHNTSDNGAHTQAIFLSIYRTLKRRGHDPLETIGEALAVYLETGILPPLSNSKSTNDALPVKPESNNLDTDQ